jgi:small subunit ribosomal protein S17
MARTLNGKIISLAMKDTAVVEVSRRVPHPLYKKLLARSKKFKVATEGKDLAIGDQVKIVETRPMAKDKYFKVAEVITSEEGKQR